MERKYFLVFSNAVGITYLSSFVSIFTDQNRIFMLH